MRRIQNIAVLVDRIAFNSSLGKVVNSNDFDFRTTFDLSNLPSSSRRFSDLSFVFFFWIYIGAYLLLLTV